MAKISGVVVSWGVIIVILALILVLSSYFGIKNAERINVAPDPIGKPADLVPFQPDSIFTVDSIAALTSCCSGKCALVLARNGLPLLAGKDVAELFLNDQLTYLIVDTGKYYIGDTVEIFTDKHGDHVHYVPANELADCEW